MAALKTFDLNGLNPFYAQSVDETKLANVKLRQLGRAKWFTIFNSS